ncbi:MAG: DEAD/DEAH box helicase [Candidatus Thermoplasmatota archaeon]|nr:DEAD/DEAH box helicase [Candidatus Thermoplasmatota archaeon]
MSLGTFRKLSKDLQQALEARGLRTPTPPQEVAIPEILAGENVLLIAPTGSGKTEAVLLPIFDLLKKQGGGKGISLLYITPLRALNRDMLRRIQSWADTLDFVVEVRHGDTPTRERRRQAVKPPDMLITTPETLQAILAGKLMRRHLEEVRWVVVDEVHQLAGNRRGVQLAVGLERLRHLAGEFQITGLSATVGNPKEMGSFLAGSGSPARILDVEAAKEVRYYVEHPEPLEDDYELARLLYTSPELAAVTNRMAEQVEEHEASLIFVNSRANAEALGSKFNLFLPGLAVHHGSLPKEERTRTEEDFKAGKLKALVCTSTLELGIDIGAVDFVIQYRSPRQVSSLVQRVGRSGHALDRTSEGVILALSPEEVLESVAVIGRAREGRVEPVPVPQAPLDVLAHQVVGVLLDAGGRGKLPAVRDIVCRSDPYVTVPHETFDSVLDLLQKLRIVRAEGKEWVVTGRGRRYYFENLSTIPDERLWPVVDLTTQQRVGLLGDEFMAKKARVGLNFVVKGRAWTMEKIAEDGLVYVNPVGDPRALVARWDGELLPIPFEVAQDVGRLRDAVNDEVARGDREDLAVHLRKEWPVERPAIQKVVKGIQAQRDADAPVPTAGLVLVEGFERYVILHTHLGERINNTLGELLEEVLSQENLLRFWWYDGYRILLELTSDITEMDLDTLADRLLRLPLEEVSHTLDVVLHERTALGYYLKFIAERFGALQRGLFLKAEELRDLPLRFRDSPIHEEALREVTADHLDLEGVQGFYERIAEGLVTIETRKGERPTPLGYPMVRRYIEHPDLLAPEGEDNLQRMRAYLDHELVNLLCMECGKLHEGRMIKELGEKPTCRECGAGLLGLVQWSTDFIRGALLKKMEREPLSEEEVRVLTRTRQSADMVLSYGRRAVVALSVYGIGPQTASRLLAKMHDEDEEFYQDLLDAKLHFITTRQYWDSA